jgi:transcriptional regulator with XRE-family HTH domain
VSTRTLARLKKDMKTAGITQDQVAAEAGVTRTHVSHVLAGRFKSKNVLETAARLLEEAASAAA